MSPFDTKGLCRVAPLVLQDSGRVSRCDVQAAGGLDAARLAAGPKRGVLCEAGPQRGRSRRQPGGGGGGPGSGGPEWEAAQRTAGPGESRGAVTSARDVVKIVKTVHR